MKFASKKYETIQEAVSWNAPTEEESQIMVLKTEIRELKDEMEKKYSRHYNPKYSRNDENRNNENHRNKR